jgi:DNA-binding MarR family transcriptional regulator
MKDTLQSKSIDSIIENIFYILPLIHKKLLKIDPSEIGCRFNLSRLHMGIMGIVCEEGTTSISEVARQLHVSKPQMTLLINQLVKNGLISRSLNRDDRRVSDISLTSKGISISEIIEEKLKNNVRNVLSDLSDIELEELSLLLLKLKGIGARLSDSG